MSDHGGLRVRRLAGHRIHHPLLRRMARLAQMAATMIDPAKYENDPKWLRLPAERRANSLRRLEAIARYLERGDRSVQSAGDAAERAGVSLRLFYKLLEAWESTSSPTIWLLIPYSGRTGPGTAKLEPRIEAKLRKMIETQLGDEPPSRHEAAAAIIAQWPADLRRPADNTIRLRVDALAGEAISMRGLPTRDGRRAADDRARATRHGEALVVDHVGLNLFADRSGVPAPITLTVAIDLFTATIAGFQTLAAAPTAASVRAALLDAAYRSRDNRSGDLVPRLIFYATNGQGWRNLASALSRDGLETDIVWGSRLHTGVFARHLLGNHIAGLPISPRVGGGDRVEGFDAKRHALVTPHQAEFVVDDAVRRMNRQRLDPDTSLNRIRPKR